MADIVIHGMEMPKTCCQCDLKIYDPEKRWDENGIEQIGAWVCKRTREIIWNTQRGENCPLVPLPEGHGRLIDADAVVKTICNSCDGACDVVQCDCLNCKADCRCDIVKEISDAPTIIEADLEWKMNNCCCFSNTDQAEGGDEDG